VIIQHTRSRHSHFISPTLKYMETAECHYESISMHNLMEFERVITLKENVDCSEYNHGEKLQEGKDLGSSPHDWSIVLVCAGFNAWRSGFGSCAGC
jgi:hypothetical protein